MEGLIQIRIFFPGLDPAFPFCQDGFQLVQIILAEVRDSIPDDGNFKPGANLK